MTQTQHTAGIWFALIGYKGVPVGVWANEQYASRVLATYLTERPEGRVVKLVEASPLSDAAPELLEALRAAEELYQVGMLNATVELVDRVVTLRRAAISKATGAS